MADERAKTIIESSEIWLSARLSTFRFLKQVSSTKIYTAESVTKLKFWDKSKWMMGRGIEIGARSLRVSSFILAFLKDKYLTFSIDLLKIASLRSESSVIVSLSAWLMAPFLTGIL